MREVGREKEEDGRGRMDEWEGRVFGRDGRERHWSDQESRIHRSVRWCRPGMSVGGIGVREMRR